jgi:HlyD family secretion protein
MASARVRRALFWLPVGLAVAGTLAWLLRPQPVAVDLATLRRGPLQVVVSDEGETRVREVFVVSAPVPGFLHRVEVHAGDPVQALETVVAAIEPADPSFLDARTAAEARAAVEAAEAARAHGAAEVRRAAAEDEFARSELARQESLAAGGVASQSALDAARRHARVARAALEEARAGLAVHEADLARARARLVAPRARRERSVACDCVDVYSPVTGRVLRVLRESEGQIMAGEPILEVGDPADLEIYVDLLSTDAVHVAPGQRVIVNGWGGDAPLKGVVRRVEPFGVTRVSALGIEEQRVNVRIDLVDPRARWERLGHGFRVEPAIVLWEAEDVLRVPFSALFRDGDAWVVFVAEDGRARERRVEIGHQNGLEAEVVSGLAEGEAVVVHPSDRVEDGARLRERDGRS